MSRKMKDSGIEWIGQIPEDWELVRTKNIYSNPKEIVGDSVDLYERLSLTLKGVLKRSKEDAKGLQPEKFEGYQILKENQLVFKLIDLENVSTSRVGLSPYTGLVSPVYIVLDNKEASKFGYYYFLSLWHREIYNKLGGDGVRSSLGAKDLLNIPYVKIPLTEQKKITNFLEEKISEIDHILEKTRESIEEYKKYKQSIITEAVTKGLNPNVEMKDSGIEWIGEIPDHWHKTKLKRIAKDYQGGLIRSNDEIGSGNCFYLKMNDIDNIGNYSMDNCAMTDATTDEIEKYSLSNNDFLINVRNSFELVGKICLIKNPPPNLLFNHMLIRIKLDITKIYPEFLKYFMVNDTVRMEMNFYKKGTTSVIALYKQDLSEINILLPSLKEQVMIASYLDNKCAEIDNLTSQKEQLLSDLELYKKSLIYECVTGKREVV